MLKEDFNINYDKISTIKVDGQDSKITNQDARKVYISKNGETKRTGDFMLGNDNKGLKDAEYISIDEYENAVNKIFDNPKVKAIKMKKTDKKIENMDELQKHIEKVKKANLIVLTKNHKIKNQDARTAAVKTSNMSEMKNVSGMFLGKDGIKMADGEYTTKEDLEFKVLTKKKKKISWPKIPKSLITIAMSIGLVALIPGVMHANSVLWHHVDPVSQNVLHTINSILGTLIGAKYNASNGIWTAMNGTIMNADAALSSVAIALGTHGINTAGISKIVADLKRFFKKSAPDDADLDSDDMDDADLDSDDMGGKTL